MDDSENNEARLTRLERELVSSLASGSYEGWIYSGENVFDTPPWYKLGAEIVPLRAQLRGGSVASHARQLFRKHLHGIESTLREAREQVREQTNPFPGIFRMVSHRSDKEERTLFEKDFIAYAVNAQPMVEEEQRIDKSSDLLDRRAAGKNGERRSYRVELKAWMVRTGIANNDEAARRLSVSIDTLKSIMSNKGKPRYGQKTLASVLKKIGHKDADTTQN
jgi:hypothetical protein